MHLVDYSIHLPSFRIMGNRDVPGGPTGKTLFFHCRGRHFSPWLGNQILQVAAKKKKNKKTEQWGTHFVIS